MTKNIFYLRSTSIINDSRASKEINSLITNNFNVTVVGWDRDKQITNYQKVIINKHPVNSIFFKFKANYGSSAKTILGLILFQLWLFLILLLNHKKYDYLHACDFDCGFISMIISKLFKKKLIYDMYDYYSDSRSMSNHLKKIINKLENSVINHADATIICGEWRKSQIKDATPKRLSIIHNTPEIKNITNKTIIKSDNKKIKIGYVGILQENRLILEVLNSLKGNDSYELHIGGFGAYESTIKELSNNYQNIFFYGSLIYNDVLALEKDCDLLFATYNPEIPNHKYSAPNKIYEAMALGKPIIVCKNTGIDKLIIKNQLGFAIDYTPKDFIKVLENIKNNKTNLLEISKNAKKLYQEKYNWQAMEVELIKLYNNLGGIK